MLEARPPYRGSQAERDMFGRGKVGGGDKKFENKQKYSDYYRAFEVVREAYQHSSNAYESPEAPRQPFPSELLSQLADMILQRFHLDDLPPESLRFYSALGSVLDTGYGIDGWVEVVDPVSKARRIVTLDVTRNPEKTSWKADVIVQALDEYPQPATVRALSLREQREYQQALQRFRASVHKVAEEVFAVVFSTQNTSKKPKGARIQ